MRILLNISLFFVVCSCCWSQHYFVGFVDKDTTDPTMAAQQLSQKSLERRKNQSIGLTWSDFPVHQPYLESLQQMVDSTLYVSRWMNGVLVESDRPDFQTSTQNMDFVSYVHDLSVSSIGGMNQIDTLSYGTAWQNVSLVGAQHFHENGNRGQGKLIAIFDGGFEGLNQTPNLGAAPPITYDFVRKSTLVDGYTSHGFRVSSIIAANLPFQYVGLAPESELALFITEDVRSETLLEEYLWLIAAERADSLGVDVINSSLGYFKFDNPQTTHTFEELDGNTAVITKAANLAVEKGMLVVNSSGNSHQSVDQPYVGFPADGVHVLCVGAVDSDGVVADFSSRGPINSTKQKPEVVALGVRVPVIDASGNTATSTGTSFSAPIITGLAALVWNQFPDLTALELKQKLIQNARDYPDSSLETGFGVPVFSPLTNLSTPTTHPRIREVYYLTIEGKKIDEPTLGGLYFKQTIFQNGTRSTQKIFFGR